MNDPVPCPLCLAPELEPSDWSCDNFSDGFSLHCEACDFEIAGRHEADIREAVGVLIRHRLTSPAITQASLKDIQ